MDVSDLKVVNDSDSDTSDSDSENKRRIATPELVREDFDKLRKVFKVLAIPIIAASARAWQLYFKTDDEEPHKTAFRETLHLTKLANPPRYLAIGVREITERLLLTEFDLVWKALARVFSKCKWVHHDRQAFEETLGEVQEIYDALKEGRHFSERFVEDLIDSMEL